MARVRPGGPRRDRRSAADAGYLGAPEEQRSPSVCLTPRASGNERTPVCAAAAVRKPDYPGDESGYFRNRHGAGEGLTAEAVADLRDLENARLNALQHALWDAAMTGDIKAVAAIVQIVQARVHLNGLEPARGGFGGMQEPRTMVIRSTS